MDQSFEVLALVGIPVWVFDVDNSRVVWGNSRALAHWNADSIEELQARDMSTDMSDSVQKRLKQYQFDCSEENRTFKEDWTLYPNGVPRTSRLSFTGFDLVDGRKGLLVQLLSELEHSSSDTLHSMQALMHTSVMIWMYDEDLQLVYTNPAARSIAKPGCHHLRDLLVHQSDFDQVLGCLANRRFCDLELQVNTSAGIRWHALNLQNSPDSVTGRKTVLLSSTDITAKRQIQEEVMVRARTDDLTGLPNRSALLDELSRRIKSCEDSNKTFALLFVDLDRFKSVNDTLGHNVGDALLVEFSRLLEEVVSTTDFVARLSGDEFVVLLADADNHEGTARACESIAERSATPMVIAGHMLRVPNSIGVCRYPEHGKTVTELLQHADFAMYAAKSSGNGFRFFEQAMGASQVNRLSIERDLAGALDGEQFELYYQPKIDTTKLEVCGVEALIRWIHPQKGMINPLDFISVAEETGLIYPIGEWVLKQAMTDQVRWRNAGMDISVAVNISPMQFNAVDFVEHIEELITQTGIQPAKLNLEVTESMLIEDVDGVSELLNSLTRRGIQISIDDFGTGYSNLANLQRYPVSCIKIDRAFVNSQQYALLEVILQMGKILGMAVVAEGVETLEQALWLRSHDCDQLQGYLFCKPEPFDAVSRFLKTFDPHAFHLDRVELLNTA